MGVICVLVALIILIVILMKASGKKAAPEPVTPTAEIHHVDHSEKTEGRLVMPSISTAESSAQKSEPEVQLKEEKVIIYSWHNTYESRCCPNCDAEIGNGEKYCESCGWVLSDR